MCSLSLSLSLSLVTANSLLIAHLFSSWNHTWDMQAQDRAFRLGQKQDCLIVRLVAENTIEEIQYQRQLYKQQLAGVSYGRHEKRYFTGVHGVKGEEGDLFGLLNLFAPPKTSEIIEVGVETRVCQWCA
jgi:DNA excision repair protein ERCC-6-like 2